MASRTAPTSAFGFREAHDLDSIDELAEMHQRGEPTGAEVSTEALPTLAQGRSKRVRVEDTELDQSPSKKRRVASPDPAPTPAEGEMYYAVLKGYKPAVYGPLRWSDCPEVRALVLPWSQDRGHQREPHVTSCWKAFDSYELAKGTYDAWKELGLLVKLEKFNVPTVQNNPGNAKQVIMVWKGIESGVYTWAGAAQSDITWSVYASKRDAEAAYYLTLLDRAEAYCLHD